MAGLDWIVLFGTLFAIVAFGTWQTRRNKNIESYLLGNKEMNWFTVGISIMATQASAITFLSTPGQAYEDGMRFVQFYFGLPLAMIVLSITVIPIFYRLKVYTAYEYLENRFDLKTRIFTAFLFLIQRGLAAGITIYAPAIVLSTMLGWDLRITNLIIGILVIIYTVTGGTRAVSKTQKYQMAVIFIGMIVAFFILLSKLPDAVSFNDGLKLAGKMGKMNVVDLDFELDNRYNIWSGILGGFFLAMSYFGTDQSQVQRYLGGRSIAQSRIALMFNGIIKVPMQFLILLIGVFVFIFYQFNLPPVSFNKAAIEDVNQSSYSDSVKQTETAYKIQFETKKEVISKLNNAIKSGNEEKIEEYRKSALDLQSQMETNRKRINYYIKKADPEAETKDTDYVFITFIMNNLPAGLVGLLFAVIFSAAMSSTSSELNALASTTTVDMYKRAIRPGENEKHYLVASRLFTLFWGLVAILFATLASLLDNLIEAVNILGSIFYGTILGIFLVAFYVKKVKGNAVFLAGLIAESVVLLLYFTTEIGFLWFNLIGCLLVVLIALIFQLINKE